MPLCQPACLPACPSACPPSHSRTVGYDGFYLGLVPLPQLDDSAGRECGEHGGGGGGQLGRRSAMVVVQKGSCVSICEEVSASKVPTP